MSSRLRQHCGWHRGGIGWLVATFVASGLAGSCAPTSSVSDPEIAADKSRRDNAACTDGMVDTDRIERVESSAPVNERGEGRRHSSLELIEGPRWKIASLEVDEHSSERWMRALRLAKIAKGYALRCSRSRRTGERGIGEATLEFTVPEAGRLESVEVVDSSDDSDSGRAACLGDAFEGLHVADDQTSAIRARVTYAWGTTPAASELNHVARHPAVRVSVACPLVSGGLDAELAAEIAGRHRANFEICYGKRLLGVRERRRARSDLSAEVTVTYQVNAHGKVVGTSVVSSDVSAPDGGEGRIETIEECLTHLVDSWTFPRVDSYAEVTQRLEFRPAFD